MCKEDVRLGREASSSSVYNAAMTGANQRMAGANANRFGLNASLFHAGAAGVNVAVLIAAKVGGKFHPIFTLTDSNHSGVATVESHGAIVLEEIWAIDGGTTSPSILYFGETEWSTDIKDI